jgi:hypothetical protein
MAVRPGRSPAIRPPASQFVSPTTTTFSVSAGTPVADSLTLTVHYDAGSGEQIVTRTAPLG